MPNVLQRFIEDCVSKAARQRLELLEGMAMAYLRAIDAKPTEIELVEDMRDQKIVWYFRKKSPRLSEVISQTVVHPSAVGYSQDGVFYTTFLSAYSQATMNSLPIKPGDKLIATMEFNGPDKPVTITFRKEG